MNETINIILRDRFRNPLSTFHVDVGVVEVPVLELSA